MELGGGEQRTHIVYKILCVCQLLARDFIDFKVFKDVSDIFLRSDVSVFLSLTGLVHAIYLISLISFFHLEIGGHDIYLDVSLELKEIMLLKFLVHKSTRSLFSVL